MVWYCMEWYQYRTHTPYSNYSAMVYWNTISYRYRTFLRQDPRMYNYVEIVPYTNAEHWTLGHSH